MWVIFLCLQRNCALPKEGSSAFIASRKTIYYENNSMHFRGSPICSLEQFTLLHKIRQISMCICQFKNNIKKFRYWLRLFNMSNMNMQVWPLVFVFYRFFFRFVIILTDWFLLTKRYFNATTLSKVTNNQIKQIFPRFWV